MKNLLLKLWDYKVFWKWGRRIVWVGVISIYTFLIIGFALESVFKIKIGVVEKIIIMMAQS